GQVWRYEDREILEFQSPRLWVEKTLPAAEVQGTWTQLVTQVDETPRYENVGRWVHSGEVSEWVSGATRRPLPRREYSKRDDYDVLIAENRHLVKEDGWIHAQWNRKQVEREGKEEIICIERGLNTYAPVEVEKLAAAEKWWAENHAEWDALRAAWEVLIAEHERIELAQEVEGVSLRKALRRLSEDEAGVSKEKALQVLRPYLQAEKGKALSSAGN
ncbi:MAG: DUF6607 family protein, partial [Verrucomicrobiales bacterium]